MRRQVGKAIPFGVVASLELTAAGFAPPWMGVMFAWAGLATGWVALAYLLERPRLLAKTSGGRWLLGPYTATAGLVARLAQRLGVSERDEVAPGLWVGGWPRRHSDTWAQLDCTSELPRRGRSSAYLCVPMLDGLEVRPRELVDAAAQARTWRGSGHPVLVHCAYGHGRSVAVACVVLVCDGDEPSLEQALHRVQRHRPRARMSQGQRAAALEAIESLRAAGRAQPTS